MKNLMCVIACLIAAVTLLTSCELSQAKCTLLYQGADVIVDNDLLDSYEVGDTLFLEKKDSDLYGSWEVAIGNIYTKDTVFIFESQKGPYKIYVAKAVLKRKL